MATELVREYSGPGAEAGDDLRAFEVMHACQQRCISKQFSHPKTLNNTSDGGNALLCMNDTLFQEDSLTFSLFGAWSKSSVYNN